MSDLLYRSHGSTCVRPVIVYNADQVMIIEVVAMRVWSLGVWRFHLWEHQYITPGHPHSFDKSFVLHDKYPRQNCWEYVGLRCRPPPSCLLAGLALHCGYLTKHSNKIYNGSASLWKLLHLFSLAALGLVSNCRILLSSILLNPIWFNQNLV